MKTVNVNVKKAYNVVIGKGLLNEIGTLVRAASDAAKVAVISDATVFALYGERVVTGLRDEGFDVCSFAFPAGEQSKNFQTLESVLNFLAENSMRRGDLILAFGGGVVGDLAGFAASVYMRGIDYVQVPTTLLAMVDSSVGGKTAIDLEKGKNLAGAFWQPVSVICDLEVLETLPSEVFEEGMGEVIKTNTIAGLRLHDWIVNEGTEDVAGGSDKNDRADIRKRIAAHLEEIITACVEYKSKIVSMDELDNKGIRNILNAGHTVGHCIEKASGYVVPHGRAVANGLLIESAMAVELGICDASLLETLKAEVEACGLLMNGIDALVDDGDATNAYAGEACDEKKKTAGEFDPDRWADIMSLDKKNDSDDIVFILPVDVGNYVEKKIARSEVRDLLAKRWK